MTATRHDDDKDFTGALNLSASTVTLPSATVTPAQLSGGFRSIASDGALALAATDQLIELVGSVTGAKAATMTATHAGHRVRIVLIARSGGSYTFAVDRPTGTSGTVTLDAPGEGVQLAYSGTAWIAVELVGGATFA